MAAPMAGDTITASLRSYRALPDTTYLLATLQLGIKRHQAWRQPIGAHGNIQSLLGSMLLILVMER